MIVQKPDEDEGAWAALAVTHDEVEARLKEGILKGEGIECIIEASIYRPRSVAPLYHQFKLMVRKDHLTQARTILSDIVT